MLSTPALAGSPLGTYRNGLLMIRLRFLPQLDLVTFGSREAFRNVLEQPSGVEDPTMHKTGIQLWLAGNIGRCPARG